MRLVWIAAIVLTAASRLYAQPHGQFLQLQGYPEHGFIEIPHDVALDSPEMTVEAWVSVRDARGDGAGCSSIAGKGYTTGWWLGVCGTLMRSYFGGTNSLMTGGVIAYAPGVWIHIAAVTDGVKRRHYINGTLVLEQQETAAPSFSVEPLRIGSDVNWDFMPQGGIDDLRIWSVARTQEEIRSTMLAPYVREADDAVGQFHGLEAWYRFEGNALDSWHGHHGVITGAGISFGGEPEVLRRRVASH